MKGEEELVNYLEALEVKVHTPSWSTVPYRWPEREAYRDVKDLVSDIIRAWLGDKGAEAHIRMQVCWHQAEGFFHIEEIQIWNSLGTLDGKGWMNKVSIFCRDWSTARIRSHKARTDKNFLSPMDEDFKELVININETMHSCAKPIS